MAYWVISLLVFFFLCHPVAYEWNKDIRGGTCLDTVAAFYSISAINLGLDLVVVVLPMPILWTLQMPVSKKVAISLIFGMGIVNSSTCAITAVRIITLTLIDGSDLSYSMILTSICSILEPCLGIISACLPVLQPALARILGGSPLEWTRKSMSSRSTKTSTSVWTPSCCAKTDMTSDTWPPLPPPNRTQLAVTNKTWPTTNERRIVRFKDVEWGDYFPKRVNAVPMSVFHCPGAERRCLSSDGRVNQEHEDGDISPGTVRNSFDWTNHTRENSGDSSQYWD
ncbi:hypothetical protein ACLMJK_004849 [Lecanora helva]